MPKLSSPSAQLWDVKNFQSQIAPVPYALSAIWNEVCIVCCMWDKWSEQQGTLGGLMEVMILRYRLLLWPQPHSTLAQQHFLSPGPEERRLFCKPQWLLHCREGRALAGHNRPFKGRCFCCLRSGLCSQHTFIRLLLSLIWWLCLQIGQHGGMAAIFSTELSHGVLLAAKDGGWAGGVKQLPSAILSVVMSQK